MKKKIFIISLISFFFVCLFSFTTLNVNAQTKTQKEMVNEEIQNINLPEVAVIDFPLPTISVYDSTIVWEAEVNQTYITISEGWAKVTRPTDENKTVTLTVTITNGAESASKEFKVTVLKGKTITNTYSITYVLNGGTNNSLNSNSYNVGDELELHAPTNGEVKFLGWYMDPEFLGESFTKLPNGLSGDVTFYAKWEEAKATSIEVTKNPVLKYTAQQTFDPTGIEVVVVYSNGEKEVIDSKELVFSIEGQNDLVVHGNTKEVKVSYKEFTTSVKLEEVTKLQYNLEGLFEAQELVYNGKSQNYTLPTLPKGLTATTQGSAKEVGTVKVKVLFTNENVDYEQPQNIEVDLTITKANLVVKPIDVYLNKGAQLPDAFKVTFDGLLGEDTESIFGNIVVTTNATDTNTLGQYTLTVKAFEAKNYNVTYQTGKLVVQESTYQIYVPEEQLNVVYNGKNQMFTAVIKDGEKVLTEITDITYEVNGFTFAGATNAGSYEVVVSYHHETYGDGKASVVFNIAKCEFDVNTVKFQNDILEYNGEEQNLAIEGTLPAGITVKYSQGATDVVTEKVIVATFEASDNYTFKNGVKTLEAKLTIAPKELETSMFEVIKHQDHTGQAVTPEVKGSFKGESFNITADFTVVYVNNVNEGKATVKVTAKENTNFTGTVELTFQIGKTPLVKVQEAAKELDDKYEALELPENFVVETTNGSSVFWLSTNTGLTIDAKGNISMIQTSEEYYVLVYALITYEGEEGTAAEYTAHVFIVPALGNTEPDTPVVPEHEHTECPECGLCTSEECDGTAEEKCQGHTQEPEQPEQEFVKLTDTSKIADGTEIVVVGKGKDKENSYTLGENGGTFFVANPFDNTNMNNVIVITLVKAEGGYKLKLGEGQYIYYSGSNNHAYVGEEKSDSSDIWTIELVEGLFKITNKANTERCLQFNSTSGQERFACYKNTQNNLVLYANPETLGEGTTEPEQPTHEHTACPTCRLCTAEDCDGTAEEKCQGHTQEPEQPTYPESGAISIEQALAIGAAQADNVTTEGKYIITGTVKEVQNSQWGNLVITDGTHEILVYGTYDASNKRYDAMATRPIEGDTVIYTGVLGQYNGIAQMKNGVVEFEVKHTHTYTNGKCECGAEDPNYVEPEQPDQPDQPSEDGLLVTFEFGANGTATHDDGEDLGTSKSYTVGTYTLKLTDMSKVFGPAYDATGKSAIKLGTSKVIGSFSFTVEENITKVVIKVAGYKAANGKVSVNGTQYTITSLSNSGAYTDITIDTTTNKTITLATVGSVYRAMVDSIAYYGAGYITPEEPEQPTHEHTACPTCRLCTSEECDGTAEEKCQGHTQEPETPTYPESGAISIEQALAIGAAQADDVTTKGEYIITGTVKEVRNSQYGNLVITDGTHEILVYGTKDASGKRYDAMATRPIVGDTVIYTGKLGQYKGTAQMKDGVVEFEVKHPHTYTNGKCECGAEDPNYVEPEQPGEGTTKTYTFANYTAGTQYAEDEAHKLDDFISITTTQSHFTSELRLYSSSSHNGFAIIECNGVIKGIGFNAGYKADTLNVYGSNDGKNWQLIQGVSITSTTYKDYTVSSTFEYKYLKLDVNGDQQIRLKSITLTYDNEN